MVLKNIIIVDIQKPVCELCIENRIYIKTWFPHDIYRINCHCFGSWDKVSLLAYVTLRELMQTKFRNIVQHYYIQMTVPLTHTFFCKPYRSKNVPDPQNDGYNSSYSWVRVHLYVDPRRFTEKNIFYGYLHLSYCLISKSRRRGRNLM